MIRDIHNIIPVTMAALLHAAFIASTVVVFDFGRPVRAAPTLIFEAELVTLEELQAAMPPPVVEEPEPELLPEPDVDQARIAAEEKKRQEVLLQEQARIKAEQEVERKRRADEAAARKKREEAELERKRAEAEEKRLAQIELQRKENELLRKQAMAAEADTLRRQEIADEDARLQARNSDAMRRYQYALQNKIQRNFIRPASAKSGIECVINVRQLPDGDVVSVAIGRCNGNDAVRRAIEAAVHKSAPLPLPEDRILFDQNLRITFKPEE